MKDLVVLQGAGQSRENKGRHCFSNVFQGKPAYEQQGVCNSPILIHCNVHVNS